MEDKNLYKSVFTGFSRLGSFPLDSSSVFANKKAALDYINAENTTAFDGQIIAVNSEIAETSGDVKKETFSIFVVKIDKNTGEIKLSDLQDDKALRERLIGIEDTALENYNNTVHLTGNQTIEGVKTFAADEEGSTIRGNQVIFEGPVSFRGEIKYEGAAIATSTEQVVTEDSFIHLREKARTPLDSLDSESSREPLSGIDIYNPTGELYQDIFDEAGNPVAKRIGIVVDKEGTVRSGGIHETKEEINETTYRKYFHDTEIFYLEDREITSENGEVTIIEGVQTLALREAGIDPEKVSPAVIEAAVKEYTINHQLNEIWFGSGLYSYRSRFNGLYISNMTDGSVSEGIVRDDEDISTVATFYVRKFDRTGSAINPVAHTDEFKNIQDPEHVGLILKWNPNSKRFERSNVTEARIDEITSTTEEIWGRISKKPNDESEFGEETIFEHIARKESEIRKDLNDEIDRASLKETELNNKIDSEIAAERLRATTQEGILQGNIDREAETRESEDTAIRTWIGNKNQEFEPSESNSDTVFSYINRKDTKEYNRATKAEKDLDDKIKAEETRASAAEQVLTDNLSAEVSRSTTRDNELDQKIADEKKTREEKDKANYDHFTDEITRIDTKIGTESDQNKSTVYSYINKVNDEEKARAKAEEERIEEKLNAEITRSTDRDDLLQGNINSEVETRLAEDEKLQNQINTISDTSSPDSSKNDFVHKSGSETITGTKTFTNGIKLDGESDITFVDNETNISRISSRNSENEETAAILFDHLDGDITLTSNQNIDIYSGSSKTAQFANDNLNILKDTNFSSDVEIAGSTILKDIAPSTTGVYSLGSEEKLWKNLYLNDNGLILNGSSVNRTAAQINDIVTKSEDQEISGEKTFLNNTYIGKKDGTDTADLYVSGNIYQQGESFITKAEEIHTNDSYIVLRADSEVSLGANEYSGLQFTKYDGTNDGRLVVDNLGTARVGDVGDERAIATRDEAENLTDKGFVYWDSATSSLKNYALNTTTRPSTKGELDSETTRAENKEKELQDNIDAESLERKNADISLQNNINTEAEARIAKDNDLQAQITSNDTDILDLQNSKQNNLTAGYGISLNPDTSEISNTLHDAFWGNIYTGPDGSNDITKQRDLIEYIEARLDARIPKVTRLI